MACGVAVGIGYPILWFALLRFLRRLFRDNPQPSMEDLLAMRQTGALTPDEFGMVGWWGMIARQARVGAYILVLPTLALAWPALVEYVVTGHWM